MKRISVLSLSVLLSVILTSCSGVSSNSALDLAGTWTLKAVSTKSQGSFSGTATITQSGSGLGTNGTTTLTAPIGQVSISQTGTALTGTITYSLLRSTSGKVNFDFDFIGTFSNGNLTITGTTGVAPSCISATSISGTVTSNSIQGTYTITRNSDCSYQSDTGTFVATKQ
jgi:hypothetical protein